MRYLRMFVNALAGGIIGATYLFVLVLQLNPQVALGSATALHWLVRLIGFYGAYLTVAIYILLLVRELLASRPLRPAWISVRLIGWLSAAGALAAAYLEWNNLKGFRTVLGEGAAERMRQGALATTMLGVLLLAIAALRYSFGRRGNRATGALLLATIAMSVMVPLALRGPGEVPVPVVPRPAPPPATSSLTPHVTMILLDGAALGFIRQRVAAGQWPNFGRLLDRGATAYLATIKPTQVEPVWTAVATGKYPPKTGVRSNARYFARPGETDPVDLLPDYCFAQALLYQRFISRQALTSAAVRARSVWDILADYGLSSGIVNWPLTFPARPVFGYLISDYFDDAAGSPLRASDALAGYPTSAVDYAREVFDEWQARPWRDVMPPVSATESEPDGWGGVRWDRPYAEAAAALEQKLFAPQLGAVRFEGLNVFGKRYLRNAQPELFGELERSDPSRSILDRYYAVIDRQIGQAIRDLAPGDLLLVVSGFGMEQESLPKRVLSGIFPVQDGTHERAPDGFLIAYGANVAQGQFPRGAIVDVAPTILYYLGLPVGRDMDGFARTDLFLRSYAQEHSITSVATHEK